MLKIGDTIKYTAQAYSNSETVGKYDGYSVFVSRMIVGETAKVAVSYVKDKVAYGDVVEILEPSQNRVSPVCKHFGDCGGCSLMHMSYGEQLNFKRNKVVNNLRKIGKIEFDVKPCFPSPLTLGYRNKLALPVSGKAGDVVVGMYRRGTHNVVNTDGCMLGGQWAAKLVEIFRTYLNEQGAEPYDEHTFCGEVRHLVARYVDGQLLVMLVSNGAYKRDLTPLAKALQREFSSYGLFVNENNNRNNVILGKVTKHICGLEYIEGEHLGVKYRLRPNSFFQVNNEVKDAIYSKVKELLDVSRTQVLVDCFSGVGVLTNVLADDGYLTYAVEIDASAAQDAVEAQRLNGKRIVNVCGDANVELPRITAENKGKVMSLVVDPPRKGLGERVCRTILEASFDNIVYVSCDSATFARDLALLSSHYDVSYVQPFDLFPQTDQVETLVHLSKKVKQVILT